MPRDAKGRQGTPIRDATPGMPRDPGGVMSCGMDAVPMPRDAINNGVGCHATRCRKKKKVANGALVRVKRATRDTVWPKQNIT